MFILLGVTEMGESRNAGKTRKLLQLQVQCVCKELEIFSFISCYKTEVQGNRLICVLQHPSSISLYLYLEGNATGKNVFCSPSSP